MLNELFPVMIF